MDCKNFSHLDHTVDCFVDVPCVVDDSQAAVAAMHKANRQFFAAE